MTALVFCLEVHPRPKSRERYPQQSMEISLRLKFRESEPGGGCGETLCISEKRELCRKRVPGIHKGVLMSLCWVPRYAYNRVNLHDVMKKRPGSCELHILRAHIGLGII